MIKIAVISDIHGNKLALDNVLEDINKFNPATIIIIKLITMVVTEIDGVK